VGQGIWFSPVVSVRFLVGQFGAPNFVALNRFVYYICRKIFKNFVGADTFSKILLLSVLFPEFYFTARVP